MTFKRKFDPKAEPLSAYLQNFENSALVNKYTNLQCRAVLGGLLPTNFIRVLQDLPAGMTYAQIKSALLRHANPPNSQPVRMEQFLHRVRDVRKESARDYALALRDLASLAYTSMSNLELDQQVLHRFARGHPKSVSQLLLVNNYGSLDDAVSAVERLEMLPSSGVHANEATVDQEGPVSGCGCSHDGPLDCNYGQAGKRSSPSKRKDTAPNRGYRQDTRRGNSPSKNTYRKPKVSALERLVQLLEVEPSVSHVSVPEPEMVPEVEVDANSEVEVESEEEDSFENEVNQMVIQAAEIDATGHDGAEYLFNHVVKRFDPPDRSGDVCFYCGLAGHFWMRCQKLRKLISDNRIGRRWSKFTDRHEAAKTPGSAVPSVAKSNAARHSVDKKSSAKTPKPGN